MNTMSKTEIQTVSRFLNEAARRSAKRLQRDRRIMERTYPVGGTTGQVVAWWKKELGL